MALLSFPPTPSNGQVFPVSPPSGTNIYAWSSAEQTWELIGKASGVSAGIYGTPIAVPEITVDATGRITFAQNLPIQLGDTNQVGLVQLTDNLISNDSSTALTAAQGFALQNQIGNLASLNPPAPNLVTAINGATAPSGVTAGTYGTATQVGRFTVNTQGRITAATNVPLAVATTASTGVVRIGANLTVTGAGLLSVPTATTAVTGVTQLVNNTTTNDSTKALTAAQGYSLQQQINAIEIKSNLTFAGSLNATTGVLTQVTAEGAAVGFIAGSPLPFPSGLNDEYFVIVDTPGTYAPPGGTPLICSPGDWFLSDGTQWIFYDYKIGSVTLVNTGAGLVGGPITTTGTISMVPATTSALGGVIPDGTTLAITPAGVLSAKSPILQQLDDISGLFNGTATSFPLRIGGVAYIPGNSANLLVSVGGVLQIPGSSFNVSAATLIFNTAPPTGTSFVGYVVTSGSGGSGGGPGTVTSVGTGIGLTGGPISTTGTISLTNTGVAPGTYTNATFTVDAQGRLTNVTAGTAPKIQYLDDISSQFNGTLSTFTLRLSGTAYSPVPSTNLMVTVGGVPQAPGVAYTVSGATITFTGAPPAGSSFLAMTVA